MADFNTNQPAPQGVGPGTMAPQESGTPVTGFTESPENAGELGNFGAGEGIPANTSKIH